MFLGSNFFTSCERPDFFLTKNMIRVGTVKQNKPESAAVFLNGKQNVFYLRCTSYLTPLPYVPARNRTFHDSIMMSCSWVRHKTTNWKLSYTIMTTESGVDVLKKLVRSTGHWNLKLWSQTHTAYSYQQALPFIISHVLLHARNTTLSLLFWNISKFCVPTVENKVSLPSLQNPLLDLIMICTNPVHIFTTNIFMCSVTHNSLLCECVLSGN